MRQINIPLFKAALARAEFTQQKLARELFMADSTLNRKIKNDSFTISEATEIIRILGITNPCEIFFTQKDT